MKKKEEESIIKKTVKAAARGFKTALLGSEVSRFVEEIKEEVEDTIKLTKQKLDEFIGQLVVKILGTLLIVSGIVVAFLGIAYFLIDTLRLERSISFIIVGFVIILFGWISSLKKS